jgi:Uma2 family endonuclease
MHMVPHLPRVLQAIAYEEEAQAYLRSLPLEHFMEATDQATQRTITLESLALVKARRADFHVFNELLVQYPLPGRRKPGQVVPDNMVVLTTEPIRASTSYNVPLEPARPFWVLAYVSKGNKRKDYDKSFRKYERQLKVPYYLVFCPDEQELTLYRHNGRAYVRVKPNRQGRYAIPKLDLEVGLLDGWVRFWYVGKLLPLPADLLRALDKARQQVADEKRRADELQQRLEAAERELAELRARRNE